ncbi:MAG TPA: hypothetical protein VK624_08685 [Steroidobacteraceae bacterium]|nr:hypothetical protein [Steroidobacteraceae bacterium]
MRWSSSLEIAALQSENDWPKEFVPAARRFSGYQWAKTIGPPDAHLFGICPLGFRWPHSLAGLERGIFEPRVFDSAERSQRGGDIDHFLVVELRTPTVVLAHLAMLVESREWHLIDGHVMHLQ